MSSRRHFCDEKRLFAPSGSIVAKGWQADAYLPSESARFAEAIDIFLRCALRWQHM
jgi:hypothetical protein